MKKFKIINPYENVASLLSKEDNHYKTNLHTHSTYSDANYTMKEMIEGFYDYDFDILAFAEHGLLGKPWDQEPTIVPLYLFQNLWHGKRQHLTTEEYKKIEDGTYTTPKNSRTKKRGLMSVTGAIEANMLTLVKNHVNGYFTDTACEGICGKENDYETPIRKIHESGGLSHINHPTDWLQARKYPDCAKNPDNVNFFANILRKYHSCLGTEVLNMYDGPNYCDRILWDELLKVIIPEGKRTVWGFANSDAHRVHEADTAFMDFILPECSVEKLRYAMENGNFFAIARYAKNELGDDFVGEGPCPTVTEIAVNQEENTITISGINCHTIDWIADGEIIKTNSAENGTVTSVIHLAEHSEHISCYVRAQLKGPGGICMTQPFICDDGNMDRFIKPAPKAPVLTKAEKRKKAFLDTRLGVVVHRMILGK